MKALITVTLSDIGLILVVLKLCNVINWSWWYVLIPFYAPVLLLVLFMLIVGIIAFIESIVSKF